MTIAMCDYYCQNDSFYISFYPDKETKAKCESSSSLWRDSKFIGSLSQAQNASNKQFISATKHCALSHMKYELQKVDT